MRIGRSGSASRMVGVGLETKKGDCGAPNGDGLQRRESLVSGDRNVLGGATGGDVTVQGAEPSLIPPRPKAGRGRPLNGEDHGDEFALYPTATGTVFVVLVDLPTPEEFEEVPRGASQVGFGLDAYESGVRHDRVVVGAIEGVDKEVHFLAGVCRVMKVVALDTRVSHPFLEGEFEEVEPFVVAD